VVIRLDPASDRTKTLTNVFGDDQVVVFGQAAEPVNLPQVTAPAEARGGAVAPTVPPRGFSDGRFPFQTETLDPDSIAFDAATFQFKSGGDQRGVTGRLETAERFEPFLADFISVFEFRGGRRVVADGHQRLALAKRAKAAGQDVRLDARIFREADGIAPAEVRVIAAAKNISQGTGTGIDAARIIKEAHPDTIKFLLNPGEPLVKLGRALAALGDRAFGMVVNGVVEEGQAAIVGRRIQDPDQQVAALDVLAKTEPQSLAEAEAVVQEVENIGFSEGTQVSLFGEEQIAESLILERARIKTNSMRQLRRDRATFNSLLKRGGVISGAGNVLDQNANRQRVGQDNEVLQIVNTLATRKGPVSEALTAAARRLRDGEALGRATQGFIDALKGAVAQGDADRSVAGQAERREGQQPRREDTAPAARAEESARQVAPPAPAPKPAQNIPQNIPAAPERTDQGQDGGEQTVLPGAERDSGKAFVEAQADKRVKGKKPQKAADEGLFDTGARKQQDIFDKPTKPDDGKYALDRPGGAPTTARTVAKFVRSVLHTPASQDTAKREVRLGKVSEGEAREIAASARQKDVDLDVTGFDHAIDNFAMRHTIKPHGAEPTETARGQLPVTEQDFARIPEIINDRDQVFYDGTTRSGRATIVYEKSFPDGRFVLRYAAESRLGRRTLSLISMRKRAITKKGSEGGGLGRQGAGPRTNPKSLRPRRFPSATNENMAPETPIDKAKSEQEAGKLISGEIARRFKAPDDPTRLALARISRQAGAETEPNVGRNESEFNKRATAAEITEAVTAELRRIAPGAKLELVPRLAAGAGAEASGGKAGGAALGRYLNGVITLAYDSLGSTSQASAVAGHEAIHYLRDVGFFTKAEWALLERESRKSWIAKHGLPGRPGDAAVVEEGIAYEYQDWRTNQRSLSRVGPVHAIFRRMLMFLRRLGNALRLRGFRTAEDIFARVASGEIGRRTPGTGRASLQAMYVANEVISTGPDGRTNRFDRDLTEWRRQIGRALSGQPMDRALSLGRVFFVLREMGVASGAVTLDYRAVLAIRRKHPDIPKAVWDSLPEHVADPLFVYPRQGGAVNVIIDATTAKGEPIIVGLRDGEIRTITPKHNMDAEAGADRVLGEVVRANEAGDRIYARDKNTLDELHSFAGNNRRRGAVAGGATRRGRTGKIVQREDVIKSQGRIMYAAAWHGGPADVKIAAKYSMDRTGETPAEKHIEASQKRHASSIMNALHDRFGYMFDPLGKLPEVKAYLAARYRTLGRIAKIEDMARGLYDTFAAATAADQKAAYDFLTTRGAKPDLIKDAKVRDHARQAKQRIDQVGRDLVRQGLLQRETYEAHRGEYLPRVYLKHLLGGPNNFGKGAKVSDLGYLKQRKDIPESVRQLILGEITDPGFLSAKGVSQPMRDMAILQFLEQIAGNKAWIFPKSLIQWEGKQVSPVWLAQESTRIADQAAYIQDKDLAAASLALASKMGETAEAALVKIGKVPDNYRQVPDANRYGRLRGMWVRKEIHDDLIGSVRMLPADGSIAERVLGHGGVATKATQIWKLSKVALNPPTQVRNFMSNAVLLHLSGVPLWRLPGRIVQAAREMAHDGAHWKIAKKYGVTATTFSNTELLRIEREMLDIYGRAGAIGRLRRMAGLVANFAGDTYQLSESLFKTAKIIDAMGKGMVEEEAALEAQKWLFDYSLVAPSVRYLRSAPVGIPFITFYTKALPRIVETAVTAPWRFLPYVILPIVLSQMIADEYDVDEKDLEALKLALPEWMRNKSNVMLLPYKDEHGRWQAFDLGYMYPWGMYQEFYNEVAKGQAGQALGTLGLFGGPLPDLIAAVKTGIDPFTKRPIANEFDPPARQVTDIMQYVWRMAAPTWVTDIGFANHMYRTLTGTVNAKTGDPLLTLPQAAARLFGTNIYPIEPEATLANNIRWMRYDISKIQQRARQMLRNPNLDDTERKSIEAEYTDLIERRAQQLVEYAAAANIHPNLATQPAP
jgi:hypothetical protein